MCVSQIILDNGLGTCDNENLITDSLDGVGNDVKNQVNFLIKLREDIINTLEKYNIMDISLIGTELTVEEIIDIFEYEIGDAVKLDLINGNLDLCKSLLIISDFDLTKVGKEALGNVLYDENYKLAKIIKNLFKFNYPALSCEIESLILQDYNRDNNIKKLFDIFSFLDFDYLDFRELFIRILKGIGNDSSYNPKDIFNLLNKNFKELKSDIRLLEILFKDIFYFIELDWSNKKNALTWIDDFIEIFGVDAFDELYLEELLKGFIDGFTYEFWYVFSTIANIGLKFASNKNFLSNFIKKYKLDIYKSCFFINQKNEFDFENHPKLFVSVEDEKKYVDVFFKNNKDLELFLIEAKKYIINSNSQEVLRDFLDSDGILGFLRRDNNFSSKILNIILEFYDNNQNYNTDENYNIDENYNNKSLLAIIKRYVPLFKDREYKELLDLFKLRLRNYISKLEKKDYNNTRNEKLTEIEGKIIFNYLHITD